MTCDIHDLITALEAAWNRKDAVAFAACFDRSAEFGAMLDGSCRGRDAIEAAHATLFTGVYAVSVITYRLMAAEPMGDWAVAIDLEQHLDFEVDGVLAVPGRFQRGDQVVNVTGHDPEIPRLTDRRPVKPGS